MSLSVLWPGWLQVAASATSTPAEEPSTVTVVAIGLSLVFAILILLTLVLMLEGKIFSSLDKRKSEKKEEKAAPAVPAPAPAAPVAAQGIPPEVVAAITAAVAEIEGGKYTLRAVKATPTGRGQWGLAGVISYTEPF